MIDAKIYNNHAFMTVNSTQNYKQFIVFKVMKQFIIYPF